MAKTAAPSKSKQTPARGKTGGKETPLMAQYNRIKAKYPDAILLFRMGDFYETFGEDAIHASQVLGITLTKRSNGAASEVELAGFPHHALETYLPKLVKAGYRVAICDQLEDPKLAKTIVKRGVTELVTPGVALSDNILDHRKNNYLASLTIDRDRYGIAFLDVSTGEFMVAEGSVEYADKLLQGFQPAEIILPKSKVKLFKQQFGEKFYTYPLEDWIFALEFGKDKLLHHFETQSLKGFGVEDLDTAIIAAGAALHYLDETEHPHISHITNLSRIPADDHVWLDRFTVRNLELLHTSYDNGKALIDVLDTTISAMGARMLKKWLLLPLKSVKPIRDRHDMVEYLIKQQELREMLEHQLKQIGDLERLVSKIPLGRINPREVQHLKRSLDAIVPIKESLGQSSLKAMQALGDQLHHCEFIREQIDKTLMDDPPVQVEKGQVIKSGVSEELDDLRDIIQNGKQRLVELQEKEVAATGIPSLKIGFNNVFGYYLEVTNAHKSKVPEGWVRKQTLVNAERYITDELKAYEEKIMGAEEKILVLERQLYFELVQSLAEYIRPVQHNAHIIAQLDCLLAFARNALQHKYRRPEVDDSHVLDIKEGRHPVIEQQLDPSDPYVPNDVFLDRDEQQMIIITGPNMAGKSALLRQTALIALMAQMGSFVPASKARIGLLDKIFTRVGASDNISSGESTFMVEMNETASIVNNISDRSLILLDEIGRGTSTYDGISIAWAITEFLHNNPLARPKTLFATHYHELNELADKLPRVRNYNVSVKEVGNKVIFLRKLVPGGSKHSFGIHVAKMAGMPKEVVDRANDILKQLEKQSLGADITETLTTLKAQSYQLSIFQLDDPAAQEVLKELEHLDVNSLSPMDALMKLHALHEKLKERK